MISSVLWLVKSEKDLGMMYFDGKGVSKNLIEAKDWFRKATAQGDENALQMLKKVV
jgi:TPR repeat protein